MKYEINRSDTYSIAEVKRNKSQVVTAIITADIHEQTELKTQLASLMYTDGLISGTTKLSRDEFLDKVNQLGGSIGVNIQSGALTISLKSITTNFNKLLKLTEDMLLNPAFSKKELVRIKETTKNELNESKENTKDLAPEGLLNQMYSTGDRRFTFEVDDLISSISKVTDKDLKNVHQKLFSRNWNCSIAADSKTCSDFSKFINKVKKGSTVDNNVKKAHSQKNVAGKLCLKNVPSKQNIDLAIGAPLPFTLHHPDFVPLSFAVAVLANWGGFAGRLMSTVREEEGLTYSIYGKLEGFTGDEQGYWRIMTFFAPDKAVQGLTSTFREIITLYKKGINQAELDKFKTILKTKQAMLNDSAGSLLQDLHAYHCHGFTVKEIAEHKAKIDSVTLKEVNDAIKQYLNPKTLSISAAGPTQTVKKELQSFMKGV